MNSLFLKIALCLVAATCNAQNVAFHDCGSLLSTINEVAILPCPNLPCKLLKGTNISVAIQFTPNTAVTDAETVVHGIIEGIPVAFPLPDDNACHFMSCPLAAGTAVTYVNVINVRPDYPTTNLIVKWEVTSSSGEVFCFTIPATITS
ncbi:hypothetical protein BsWGS_14760 [Bradybaena similaris]